MKTIIFKPIFHINSEHLPTEIIADILGDAEEDCKEIYVGSSNQMNDPIKINALRKYLDVLEEKGANYVSIDFHTDHQELEIGGMFIGIATQEEINLHNQKDKEYQINFAKERIQQYSTQLGLFQTKLKELSGE